MLRVVCFSCQSLIMVWKGKMRYITAFDLVYLAHRRRDGRFLQTYEMGRYQSLHQKRPHHCHLPYHRSFAPKRRLSSFEINLGKDFRTDGRMDGRTKGCTDGRMDGRIDGRTDEFAIVYRCVEASKKVLNEMKLIKT